MFPDVDPQDLLRQIGFNSLVAQARDSLSEAPGTLARVVEHSRSNSIIHTGTALYEARARPALARLTPLVVGDWVHAAPDVHQAWADAQRAAGGPPREIPLYGRPGLAERHRAAPGTAFHTIHRLIPGRKSASGRAEAGVSPAST